MYFKYLSFLVRHKWYVFIECWKEGIWWRGVTHDLSKLRPSEFFPYAEHFYGTKDNSDIDFAWLLHQKRNKHHWQWWLLTEDEGETKALSMADEYMKEMFCDWKGAGKVVDELDIKKWYIKNKNNMCLHPTIRLYVEYKLFEGG